MMQKVDMASAMHGMPSRVLVVVTLATVTANTAPVYRLVTKKFLTKKTPKFFGVFYIITIFHKLGMCFCAF